MLPITPLALFSLLTRFDTLVYMKCVSADIMFELYSVTVQYKNTILEIAVIHFEMWF